MFQAILENDKLHVGLQRCFKCLVSKIKLVSITVIHLSEL